MKYETVRVECYSGYKVNGRPTAFTYQGRRWEVREIVDHWYEGTGDACRPEVDYFKVKTTEDRAFILRYLALFDSWSIGV